MGTAPKPASETTERCACGWRRPLIAVTTTPAMLERWFRAIGVPLFPGGADALPMPDVAVISICPDCGFVHLPRDVSESEAARIVTELGASLAAGKARS